VSVAPVIPFITEPELERVLEAARDAGDVSAHYVVLRLPWEVNPRSSNGWRCISPSVPGA